MFLRRCKPCTYYKTTCTQCHLIIAVREVAVHTRSHPPLRPLASLPHCPFCQGVAVVENEILPEEFRRIERSWDLLAIGEEDSNSDLPSICPADALNVIDLSAL